MKVDLCGTLKLVSVFAYLRCVMIKQLIILTSVAANVSALFKTVETPLKCLTFNPVHARARH